MTVCSSCQKTNEAMEICPFCFSSQVGVSSNYTEELSQQRLEASSIPLLRPEPNILRLADITYTPSSSLKRWLFRFRGIFSTVLISVFVLSIAGYFTINHFRNEIEQSKKVVHKAIRNSDFETAAQQWEAIFEKYGRFFDTDGQVEALINKSNCWQKAGKPEFAISELQRALSLKPSENLREKLSRSYRYLGLYKLQESEVDLSDKFYKEAEQKATKALHAFAKSPASPAETARVHRVLARTDIHYGEFDSATQHQEAAVKAEGKTKRNKKLAKQIKLAKQNSRRRTASTTKRRATDEKMLLEAWRKSQPTRPRETARYPKRSQRRSRALDAHKRIPSHKPHKPAIPSNFHNPPNPYVHNSQPHTGFQRTRPPQPRVPNYSAYKRPNFPSNNPGIRSGYGNRNPYSPPAFNRPQMPSPRGIPGRPY